MFHIGNTSWNGTTRKSPPRCVARLSRVVRLPLYCTATAIPVRHPQTNVLCTDVYCTTTTSTNEYCTDKDIHDERQRHVNRAPPTSIETAKSNTATENTTDACLCTCPSTNVSLPPKESDIPHKQMFWSNRTCTAVYLRTKNKHEQSRSTSARTCPKESMPCT